MRLRKLRRSVVSGAAALGRRFLQIGMAVFLVVGVT
jgi:hypothetical protein